MPALPHRIGGMVMLKTSSLIALWIPATLASAQELVVAPPVKATVRSVECIWDQAPHNAFTDLVRWRGRFYCAFREGRGHAGDRGHIRVIASEDGSEWASVARLGLEGFDLRDADLSVTPDDRLLVLGATAFGPEFYLVPAQLSVIRGGINAFEMTCREMRTQLEKMREDGDPTLIDADPDPRAAEYGVLHGTLEMHVRQLAARPMEPVGSLN